MDSFFFLWSYNIKEINGGINSTSSRQEGPPQITACKCQHEVDDMIARHGDAKREERQKQADGHSILVRIDSDNDY